MYLHHISLTERNTEFMKHGWWALQSPGLSHQNPRFVSSLWLGLGNRSTWAKLREMFSFHHSQYCIHRALQTAGKVDLSLKSCLKDGVTALIFASDQFRFCVRGSPTYLQGSLNNRAFSVTEQTVYISIIVHGLLFSVLSSYRFAINSMS